MGLSAIGINPGDEVILADINWIATVAPVVHLGAKPVFVDILSDTWCIDPEAVEKAITPKTKAIIATHIYGNVCDMGALVKIAEENNIYLIEDAAESLGSTYEEFYTGVIGDFGVFSFHGSKTITTGEGGMLVTNTEEIYEKVLTLNNHGRNRDELKQFWPESIGYKFKTTDLQAAVGYAQMKRLTDIVDRKRSIFHNYSSLLTDLGDMISMNSQPENCVNSYWMPTVVFNESLKVDRDCLLRVLSEKGIDSRVFFWPLSSLPMFESVEENKVSYNIYPRGINLPSYFNMTHEDQERVVETIKEYILK